MIIRYTTNHITMTLSTDEYATILTALKFSQGGAGFDDCEPTAIDIIAHCKKSQICPICDGKLYLTSAKGRYCENCIEDFEVQNGKPIKVEGDS